MPIKRITYTIILVCFAFLLVVGLWIYRSNIQNTLKDLVVSGAKNKATSVNVYISDLHNSLKRLAVNIASCYQANHTDIDKSPASESSYPPSWKSKSFFADNDLNCLIWWSAKDGEIFFSRYYDKRLDMFVDLPSPVAEAIAYGATLPPSGRNCTSSLAMIDEHPLILASKKASGQSDPAGSEFILTVGQIVDQGAIRVMRNITKLHVIGIAATSSLFPQALFRQPSALPANDSLLMEYETDSGFRIGTVLTDANAAAAFLLQVEPEEGEMENILELDKRYRYFFIALTLAIMFLLLVFFSIAIFSPLARFSKVLNKINLHEYDLTRKPAALGYFTDLGNGLIELVTQIDRHDREKYKSDSRLMYRVKVEESLSIISRILFRESISGIIPCLRILSRNFNTDFAFFWQVSTDRQSMHCYGCFRDLITGEYTGEYDFTAPTVRWINDAIRHNGSIEINDINNIPQDLEDVKRFVQEFEVKSFFGVPMNSASGRVGGFIAIGSIHNIRTWLQEDRAGLESVAEMFAFMLDKHSNG